jgi:hypothetical protein
MIKAGDMQAVQRLIGRLGNEIKALVKSALEISYFSRGAWSYHQVLMMSQAEREIAVDFINERLKIAGKSAFPVY